MTNNSDKKLKVIQAPDMFGPFKREGPKQNHIPNVEQYYQYKNEDFPYCINLSLWLNKHGTKGNLIVFFVSNDSKETIFQYISIDFKGNFEKEYKQLAESFNHIYLTRK